MTVATTARRTINYSYLNQQFPLREIEAYLDDIRHLAFSGDFTLGYPVRDFEAKFSAITGQHTVGANSGTAALVLILRALGIGPGCEVIVPTNTFVASAGAVAMVGATPVFCDNLDDFTIDPASAEAAITPRTKGIIAVHLTGNMADMPMLRLVGLIHDLSLIEDAAQAHGATLDGKPAGSFGEAAAWSMHPLKMVNVWGDAGAVTTMDEDLADRMRLLRNHGLQTRDDAVIFGDNLRISSLQAAIACRVLDKAERSAERRRANALRMTQLLAPLSPVVQTPIVRSGVNPVYQTYIIRCEKRDDLREHLLARGIDVKIHYPKPLHLQTVGLEMGYSSGQFPVAERHARTMLTLPMHEFLTDDDLEYMATQIRGFYE